MIMNDITEKKLITPLELKKCIALSVDVEDYFMSPECIPFEDWPRFMPAIHEGMDRLLDLLKQYNAKATFFFVGWLAERFPELVQKTAAEGHEIGSHSFTHKFVHLMDQKEFTESVKHSLDILRAILPGQEIIGFRAPAFSLETKKSWQFAILHDHGIRYDSSIIPYQNYLYGDATAPRHPYWIDYILEIPPATIKILGKKIPVGGGGTLRIFPSWFTAFARKRYQEEGFPPVIYIHPWEMVPDHPPLELPFKQRWMHYAGLKGLAGKLESILMANRVITMGEYWKAVDSG